MMETITLQIPLAVGHEGKTLVVDSSTPRSTNCKECGRQVLGYIQAQNAGTTLADFVFENCPGSFVVHLRDRLLENYKPTIEGELTRCQPIEYGPRR